MSKKLNSKTKLVYRLKHNLPQLKKYPTKWDMKGLYYKSLSDPAIEKDIATTEKAYKRFETRFRDSDFTTNPKTLLAALQELNTMAENPVIGKGLRYLSLLTALDTGNEAAIKKCQLLEQRITRASNRTLFFGLALAKIDKKQQQLFLSEPSLQEFHYDLKQLFTTAKYQLSEQEEKIIRELGGCSYGMWVEATEKMLGKRSVTFDGRSIPVNTALDEINALPGTKRKKLWSLIMTEIDPLKEFVEHELTAIVTRKKISDQLRGYKKPYSAAIVAHEDDEKSVEAMIHAVSTKGFTLSKKFYALKAKLHNKPSIGYAERSLPIKEAPKVPFDQATNICRDVFYDVNPIYGEIFDRLLTNGQIDVYPTTRKRGGAFCWGDTGQPTNVFLNHVDTVRSLETYAHEMGHAIHTERSKVQPPHYQSYTTTTAETASTLFEGLLFDSLLEQAPQEQQAALLHDKLIGDISTIQRQIALHNFEVELHTIVREQGGITHEELNQVMQKHLRSYLGNGVTITKEDGNSYIYWSHIRYGFYVYTYAFGILMSSIMAKKWKEDSAYASKIDTFLTAGGSDTVANIFKSIGINTKKVATFTAGLDTMAREIKQLEKLLT